jgi:hypothetical protein
VGARSIGQASAALFQRTLLVVPASASDVAKLIADLDSPTFATRQKASQMLDTLSEKAEGAMRKALKDNPTLETRQRLEEILKKADGEVLRRLRAIDALDQIGTAGAREVLESLAKSTPNPRVAEAAEAALARLDRRPQ